MIRKFSKKRVKKPKKAEKKGLVIHVEIKVHVHPEQMRPYPAIQNLDLDHIALQLIENACTADFRWMDGIETVESVRTSIVERDGKRVRS